MSSAAVVVGAAGAIGRAVLRRVAESGRYARVVATARCLGAAQEAAKEVGRKEVVPLAANLDEEGAAESVIEEMRKSGGLETVVFVPEATGAEGPITQTTTMEFDQVWMSWIGGAVRIARAALPELRTHSNGSFVLVGSTLGYTPFLGAGAVSTAAAAQLALVQALAWDAGKVRVNAVVPGPMADDGTNAVWTRQEEAAKALAQSTPLGRLCTPDDVAAAVQFLASERARYVTGENLVLAGGVTVRF